MQSAKIFREVGHIRCLSLNAQSIRSKIKLPDGTFTSDLKTFQYLVYAERLDMIKTWLNNNVTINKILPKGYHVIGKDRVADKREREVLITLRNDIVYNRVTSRKNSPNWSDRSEIIALELKLLNSKRSLVCACYRPLSCDLDEWNGSSCSRHFCKKPHTTTHFYQQSRLTAVEQITFHDTKIKHFTFHANKY